jgi:signal transduction histidine kinase
MIAKSRLLGPLGWRLFVAFILSTVGVVAVVALLAVFSVRRQTDSVVAAQLNQQRAAVVESLIEAYHKAGDTWNNADLTGVGALARAAGASVVVVDSTGTPVFTQDSRHGTPGTSGTPGTPGTEDNPARGGEPEHSTEPGHTATAPATSAGHGRGGGGTGGSTGGTSGGSGGGAGGSNDNNEHFAPTPVAPTATPTPAVTSTTTTTTSAGGSTVAIMVGGIRIGSLTFDPPSATDSAAWQARTAVLRTVGIASALAVVLAGLAALGVSRTISRPLVGLAAAARAVEAGAPDAGKLLRPGPGELGQVSRAFGQMANTLRREDELRRALVADVAHELRTPLTILRGQTEQLLDGLADPSTERLTSLHEEVLRLDALVEDLATLSAAEAAGLRMERRPVDLEDVVGKAVTAMRPQYDAAKVGLELTAQPVLGYGDPQRLTQVVSNLLGNAVKFTPGGGTVSVALLRSGASAVLTIADTGPGIPEEDRPHVFDRFWRGKAAGASKGSGIGLAVVAELVTAHTGTVRVDAAPGGGALFTIRLPATT